MNYCYSQSVDKVTGSVVEYKTIVKLQNGRVYLIGIGNFKYVRVE